MKNPEMMHWSEAEHPPPVSCSSSSEDDLPLPLAEEAPSGFAASRKAVVASVVVVAAVLLFAAIIVGVVVGGAMHSDAAACAYKVEPACPLRYSDFLAATEAADAPITNGTRAEFAMILTVMYDYAVGAELNAARAACTGGVVSVEEPRAVDRLPAVMRDFLKLVDPENAQPQAIEVVMEVYSIARGKTCPA